MKKPGRKTPGKSDDIEDEDRFLWEQVTKSVTPLDRTKPAEPAAPDADIMRSAFEEVAPNRKRKKIQPASPPQSKNKIPPGRSPQPTRLDHKSAKRLRSGRIDVEARLDLHGMRQTQAHTALRRFIASAQARGLRWVLVITGKGGPKTTRFAAGNADHENDWTDAMARERGVLKRSVPQWLCEAELRAYVVGYSRAAAHHGGDGALYVQIRKLKARKSKT